MNLNWLNFKIKLRCSASAGQVQDKLKGITTARLLPGLFGWSRKKSLPSEPEFRYEGAVDGSRFFLVSTKDTELNGKTYKKNSAIDMVGEIVPYGTGCEINAKVSFGGTEFFYACVLPILLSYWLIKGVIENGLTGPILIFLGGIVVVLLSIPVFVMGRYRLGLEREREFLEAFLEASNEPVPVLSHSPLD